MKTTILLIVTLVILAILTFLTSTASADYTGANTFTAVKVSEPMLMIFAGTCMIAFGTWLRKFF